MHLTRKQCWTGIRAILFLALTGIIFIHTTYLFRNVQWKDRRSILGFYDQEKNSLDVVYVGSSAVYRFWNSMLAWEKYGYTSYAYSTASMNGKTYMAAIKDIQERQKDAVIMVEARGFLEAHMEASITAADRRVFDSLDFDWNRWRSLYDYQKITGIAWKDMLPEYLDLMYYHSNYYALWDKVHWKLADNRTSNTDDSATRFKRFSIKEKVVPMEDPSIYRTEEKHPMTEMSERFYRNMLQYASEQDLKLVVVASPWIYGAEAFGEYNTMKAIAAEYGIPFVNSNENFADMGMDVNTDFYNRRHVNFDGANKYTEYISKYLMENYTFNENKTPSTLASWNKVYEKYKIRLENGPIDDAEEQEETED